MSSTAALEVKLRDIEQRYSMTIPALHRRILLDSTDPIHQCCTLLFDDFQLVNDYLHEPTSSRPWPEFLLAFAKQPKDSDENPEFFAYDMRFAATRIVLIIPDRTIERCLHAEDRCVFSSFEEWYHSRLERYRVFGI